MMDELPAYSWQQLRRLSNATEGVVWVRSGERGWGASTNKGWHSNERGDTKDGMGCWLKRVARIRTASRKFREQFSAFLEIFLPPLAGVYSVARRNQTPRPPTSKANIWSHATKNSRPANRRVDLFPYDAAFFAIFFPFLPSTVSCRRHRPSSSTILQLERPRDAYETREPSSIHPKMTSISQVKGKRVRTRLGRSVYRPTFFASWETSYSTTIDRRPYTRVPFRVFRFRYIEFRPANCKLMSVEINWNLSVEKRNYLSFW